MIGHVRGMVIFCGADDDELPAKLASNPEASMTDLSALAYRRSSDPHPDLQETVELIEVTEITERETTGLFQEIESTIRGG